METRSFLEALHGFQLLDPGQMGQVRHWPQAQVPDTVGLARELVQRGWLTTYQVNSLVQGRGKELRLDAYQVLERLGEGGMGQVLKARHVTMNRLVALKIIRKDLVANPGAVQRFRQEIQAAAQLIHRNIVVAYDAGQANNTHFFAMEYVEGIDLAKLVQQSGPLPVADACEYIRQAALGLQHAYERGMVHRDIKPSNLLLSQDSSQSSRNLARPVVKILDMGLARLQDTANVGLTRTGAIVGTPAFLSPEQALNSAKIDIRSDLYSLGCTFYFLLTGKTPFDGCSVLEVLVKHRESEPPLLSSLRSGVPPEVQAMISKLLAKRPEDRFQTPAKLVIELHALRASATTMKRAKRPAGTLLPTSPDRSKRRIPVWGGKWPQGLRRGRLLLAGIAVFLLAGIVWAGMVLVSELKPFKQSVPAGKLAEASEENNPVLNAGATEEKNPVLQPEPTAELVQLPAQTETAPEPTVDPEPNPNPPPSPPGPGRSHLELKPGFAPLFNGKDLSGWKNRNGDLLTGKTETTGKSFVVRDGMLLIDGAGTGTKLIHTAKEFPNDVQLSLEFFPGNGSHIDILIHGRKFNTRRRSLDGNINEGKWNELQIIVQGNDVRFKCNGVLQQSPRSKDTAETSSPLMIRAEGGQLKIRRLGFKEGQ